MTTKTQSLDKNKIINRLRNEIPNLKEKYRVKSLGLFGSYLRDEQTVSSDVDILVEFSEVVDLIEFIKLEIYLSELLNCDVDLVLKDALKPRIKDSVLSEEVTI